MRLFLLFILLCCVNSLDAENLRLWYSAPAKNWWEALPVGNSHIGGMVYGGTTREEIQINEETSSFSGNVIVINMNSDKGKIQDFDLSYSCPLAVSIENIGSDLIVKCEGVEHGAGCSSSISD